MESFAIELVFLNGVFMLLGLIMFVAGLLNWEWIFETPLFFKFDWIRDLFGIVAGRIILMVSGSVIILWTARELIGLLK
ncbi:MAG: hypothetical protein ACM3QZ_05260 [Solirubrobacterales bacterium]